MTLVRWRPTNRMMTGHEHWNRVFNDMLGYDAVSGQDSERGWAPRVDIIEDEAEYRFIADLPGLKREDVDISLENDVLTISGESSIERDEEKENIHMSERSYGRFSRRFNLHNKVNIKKINAEFDNGELTIHLPKVEEMKPRKIKINAN